jgi:hypothetical protein
MRRWQPYHQPPRAVRTARLDNIAIVPGSLLPYKATYQALANRLPPGDVLLVLPADATLDGSALAKTQALFEAKGHHVTTLRADDLVRRSHRGHA